MKHAGVPVIHHHGYVSNLPPRHRFPMRKFHGVMRYLRRDHVISMKQVNKPEEISAGAASLVHTQEYIDKFFYGKTSQDEQRKTGFVWNEGLVRRCRLETGIQFKAVFDLVLKRNQLDYDYVTFLITCTHIL